MAFVLLLIGLVMTALVIVASTVVHEEQGGFRIFFNGETMLRCSFIVLVAAAVAKYVVGC